MAFNQRVFRKDKAKAKAVNVRTVCNVRISIFWKGSKMKKTILLVLVLALGLATEVANAATINQAPIADVGLSRYAAQDYLGHET